MLTGQAAARSSRSQAGSAVAADKRVRASRRSTPLLLLSLILSALPAGLVIATPLVRGHAAAQAWNAAPFPLVSPPVVLQVARNDCGPAVVATLLTWLGSPVGLPEVTAEAQLGPDGLNLGEFARLAHAFGLQGAWYRATPSDLPGLPGPFVAHLSAQISSAASAYPGSAASGSAASGSAARAALPPVTAGHLVVVWGVGKGAVLVSDPAVGAYSQSLEGFSRAFTGRVYLLEQAT